MAAFRTNFNNHDSTINYTPDKANDRYVDKNYDYHLGDGRYAYIGATVKTDNLKEIGIVRTKDIHETALTTRIQHTTYRTRTSEMRNSLLGGNLVVVVYNRDALVRKGGKDPVIGSKAVQVIPLQKFANTEVDALGAIYKHHLEVAGKIKSGMDPYVDSSLFSSSLLNYNAGFQTLDKELKCALKGWNQDDTLSKSEVATGVQAAATNKQKNSGIDFSRIKDDQEPVFKPVAIPFKPTEAERSVQYLPGYTRIGYTAFMLPPEQIIYTRAQPLETKQLIRANGSNKRGYGHSLKEFQIQMRITDTETANKVLLPIIRQFQKTPFVPVVNELLNDTYDVHALALEAIQIATVPGYPNEFDVVIQAAEFNWRAYMPGEHDLDSTFCYPLYKLWCEDRTRTNTRPIGWKYLGGNTKYLPSQLKEMGLDKMNGEFTMYTPKEDVLRRIEQAGQAVVGNEASDARIQSDAFNISEAQTFLTEKNKETRENLYKKWNPDKGGSVPNAQLMCYKNLRIPVSGNYSGKATEEMLGRSNVINGAKYVINEPAVAVKITSRQFAKELLETIKHTITMSELGESTTTPYMDKSSGLSLTNTMSSNKNPFTSGVLISKTKEGTPVTQKNMGSEGHYEMNGMVVNARAIGNYLDEKLNVVANGAGGDIAKDIDASLADSYFIMPKSALPQFNKLMNMKNALTESTKSNTTNQPKLETSLESFESPNGREQWEETKFDTFVINQISVGGENLLAALMPQMQDSPVHQFLGKADCNVIVRGTITDKADVEKLRWMLDREEYLTRMYSGLHVARSYSGYMCIENEICRLMGITEVLPIKCEITTSQEVPGTFDVELVFSQFNPLQQYSEEMKALTDDSRWYKNSVTGEIETEDGPNPQSRSDGYYESILRAEYFNKKLRLMELYPDMALPTFGTIAQWIKMLTGDELSRNIFLKNLGVEPESFPWTTKDCKALSKIDIPKDSDNESMFAQAFLDPDFYCAPTFPAGADFVEGVLKTLSGITNVKHPWVTQINSEIVPENMKLRDRYNVSQNLPFMSDLEEPTGNVEGEQEIYSKINVPDHSVDTSTYVSKALVPENIKKSLEGKGFSADNMTAVGNYAASFGVPQHVAYYLFNEEGGAGKQRDGATPDGDKPYGCGQVIGNTVTAINNILKNNKSMRDKCPWGADYQFSRSDRADHNKAIWMSLAYYTYQYQCIARAQDMYLSGKPIDKNKCWALAQAAYVYPSSVRGVKQDGVDSVMANLPAKIKENEIKSRVDRACAVLKTDPASITNTVQQKKAVQKEDAPAVMKLIDKLGAPVKTTPTWNIPSPKFTESFTLDTSNSAQDDVLKLLYSSTPAAKTSTAAKVTVESTEATPSTKKSGVSVVTAVDDRANYFLICRNMNTDQLGFISVYAPRFEEQRVGVEYKWMLSFIQKSKAGTTRPRRLAFSEAVNSAVPGDLGSNPHDIQEDSLNYFRDERYQDFHYYLVRSDTERYPNKSDYDDWDSYIAKRSVDLADVQFLSGDPSGKLLWDENGESNSKFIIDKTGLKRCTNIPDDSAKTYKLFDMFYREDGKDMFYDMRNYSGHGRLLPAFPTYCLLLVDGGRWLRYYRLFDKLFGMTAVESIEIFKSRKTPTDVANITFANMYGHLTKQPAESPVGKVYSWSLSMVVGAVQDTVAGNFGQDELTRWQQHCNSLLLRPGARMHIRMGYGSNPNRLPVLFNGVVSEITPGQDSVQVVGLGDGVELEKLLQPNDKNADGKSVYKVHSLFGAATTPREIMLGVLAPANFFELVTSGGYDANNPHGIEHFGSPTYTFMHKNANEVGMNIYEATPQALYEDTAGACSTAWGGTVAGLNLIPGYGLLDGGSSSLLFGVSIEDATAWDVFTTCRKAVPEYICAVHPFGLRSTLFYGKPYWPLRYDYRSGVVKLSTPDSSGQQHFVTRVKRNDDDSTELQEWAENEMPLDVVTHWKPFSQMHVISSPLNLISNQIKASDEDVYTICQAVGGHNGLFTKDGGANDWSSKVFLDTDIYPEHQKTLYVKSGLYSTDFQLLSDALKDLNISPLVGFTRKVGNTYAVNTLKDSVMDMYQGHAVIVGDPSIKPHDRVFLADTRAEMHGMFQVKEVTHHLSFATGLISTVSPDLLASVTDFADQMCWSWLGQFGHRLSGALASQYMVGTIAAKRVNPFRLLDAASERLNTVIGKSQEAKEVKENIDGFLRKVRASVADKLGKGAQIIDSPEYTAELDKLVKTYAEDIHELTKDWKFTGSGPVKKAIGGITDKLVSWRQMYKLENDVAKIGSTLKYALNADNYMQMAAELRAGFKDLDVVKLLGRRGGIATTAAKLGKLTVYTLGIDCLTEWVNRKLAYRQSLVLRPLLINGREFTAGIDGHMGCVAGDPDGYWDGVIQSMTNWNYNKDHNKGRMYGFNDDSGTDGGFGDIAFGLINVLSWAAGINPAQYSNLSDSDMDTYILGGNTGSDAQHSDYVQRYNRIARLLSAEGQGPGETTETPQVYDHKTGGNNYVGTGEGFDYQPKEPAFGDYGKGNCNRYVWDVAYANGWIAKKRKPGTNTGITTDCRIEDLPNNHKLVANTVPGVRANKKENLKPGMIIYLKKSSRYPRGHYAIISNNMTLNESLSGKEPQINRPVAKECENGAVGWAVMPRYENK